MNKLENDIPTFRQQLNEFLIIFFLLFTHGIYNSAAYSVN